MLFMDENMVNHGGRITLITALLLLAGALSCRTSPLSGLTKSSEIAAGNEQILLQAGIVSRTISTAGRNIKTTSFVVSQNELLESESPELAFTVYFANPNLQPIGVKPAESGVKPESAKSPTAFPMQAFKNTDANYADTKGVKWVTPLAVNSMNWSQYFEQMRTQTYSPSSGVTRFGIDVHSAKGPLRGLECKLTYEVYDDYPVVRKWVSITNHGDKWIKIDQLSLEALALKPEFRNQTALAPGAFDDKTGLELDAPEKLNKESLAWVIGPSVVSFGTADGSRGVIASSEIPSAMRQINNDGSMGYRKALFEWVLGPSENFTSEPVFYYGYSGKTWTTASALSTPRDRAVEGPYKDFLSRHVGIVADQVRVHPPLWNIWEVTWRKVNDKAWRRQAEIAARCGFKQIEIDAGWQSDQLGTHIDEKLFPNFSDTCDYVRSLGLYLSLWVSNYRMENSPDCALKPDSRAVPLRTKPRETGVGYGMSYCSPEWRKYFARDLVGLYQDYGIIGFKEDHINIRGGDIGFGHESRTRKESLLRGFRGLFDVQDSVHQIAPDMITMISHELYWDMPNPGCDIAALKHAVSYHIPPNTHYGSEDYFLKAKGKKPATEYYGGAASAAAGAQARQKAFIKGCKVAREQIYAHRALPLRTLQFYALITINDNGSLTPWIQDRQICSLLMGAPFLFSGDLTTLTEENINHYAQRFKLLDALDRKYAIYRHFQYSGVPVVTDTDWHWWGKLNKDGYGAVVILRGSNGESERIINIPWVKKDATYSVRACFAEKELGTFTGKQLQSDAIRLALPVNGQEIFEIAPAKK